MVVEYFCGKEVTCMPDMEKVEKLTSILEERSGLGVREAVARSIHYLDGYESYLYSDEVKYLLELSMSRRSRRSDSENRICSFLKCCY